MLACSLLNAGMTLTSLASIFAIALTGLIPASCNNSSVARGGSGAKTTSLTNSICVVTGTNCILGELLLTNHTEQCIQIGTNKQCFFTTLMIDRRNAQITLALECKATKNKPANLSVTQIVTKSDHPFEVALGDYSLSFTPHIISE